MAIVERNFVWLDLEMTGLRPEIDVILEIASVITDNQLNIIAYGPEFVIHQPEEKLALMDAWVKNQHEKSGLTEKVRKSTVTLAEAQEDTTAFIKAHCTKNSALLAGNSVWQDRTFLYFHMPQIVEYLNYRLLDVSTIKELARQWYPKSSLIEFKKKDSHRAMDDVIESIAELKHYRKHFWVSNTTGD